MAYPRRCPLCEADYHGAPRRRVGDSAAPDLRHVTLAARPGGTPDPRYPTLPGRLLTLRCQICRGEYAWDFFAEQPAFGTRRRPY